VHQPICYKSHTDVITTVLLHTVDDKSLDDCLMQLCTPG